MSTRPYIKLDPDLPDRKDYYPDGAFRALVETFCAASYQPTAGEFKSDKLLKVLLGARAKWVAFLIEEGDLGLSSTGVVFVNHWAEWQEGKYKSVADRMTTIRGKRGAMTPAERAFLYRQRQRDAKRDASRVTDTVTPTVTGGLDRDIDSDLDMNHAPRDGGSKKSRPTKQEPSSIHDILSRIGKSA